MRKIVAGFAASVDGYIEGPKGEIDWIIIDEKIDFAEQFKRFDAFFYGRRSYEASLSMGSKPSPQTSHYVFSNTLTRVEPGFVLMQGDAQKKVERLKQQSGKDIAVFGGASLLASLLNMQLVDELSISFIPVLLGEGKPMVAVLDQRIHLQFVSSRRYENGTFVVTYNVHYNGVQ